MTAIPFKCILERIGLPNYYYEPIQINVVQSGNYTLSSVDSINGVVDYLYVVGYLYKEHFDQFIPDKRLIARNSGGCPNDEFKIITELQSSVTYILIMTPAITPPVNKISLLTSNVHRESIHLTLD